MQVIAKGQPGLHVWTVSAHGQAMPRQSTWHEKGSQAVPLHTSWVMHLYSMLGQVVLHCGWQLQWHACVGTWSGSPTPESEAIGQKGPWTATWNLQSLGPYTHRHILVFGPPSCARQSAIFGRPEPSTSAVALPPTETVPVPEQSKSIGIPHHLAIYGYKAWGLLQPEWTLWGIPGWSHDPACCELPTATNDIAELTRLLPTSWYNWLPCSRVGVQVPEYVQWHIGCPLLELHIQSPRPGLASNVPSSKWLEGWPHGCLGPLLVSLLYYKAGMLLRPWWSPVPGRWHESGLLYNHRWCQLSRLGRSDACSGVELTASVEAQLHTSEQSPHGKTQETKNHPRHTTLCSYGHGTPAADCGTRRSKTCRPTVPP